MYDILQDGAPELPLLLEKKHLTSSDYSSLVGGVEHFL